MNFDNLLIERDQAVATITINRPRVLNALNTQTLDELRRAILGLKHDEGVRAVVITGAGDEPGQHDDERKDAGFGCRAGSFRSRGFTAHAITPS